MRFFLKILESPLIAERGSKIALAQGKTVAGRISPPADLLLVGSKVSKRHCLFSVSAEGALVEDTRSSNGVFLNGKKIAKAMLSARDRLVVGDFVFEVVVE